jgi:GntR family transcriptional regulator/MocR family aminotransferase
MGETTERDTIPKRATTLSLAGVDLDRTVSVPLYRQLYDELRGAILSGRMAAGARLPSTRGLAAELGVARLTVLEAFEQLYADGYVEGRSGSGSTAIRPATGRSAKRSPRIWARRAQARARRESRDAREQRGGGEDSP